MDELLVECSIHLDGVQLKDVRTFKCGHGFCTTCVDALFAEPPPFKCPTCRKRIQRKDALQIFLNPHRSFTQPNAQSSHADVDVDLTLSDDPESNVERVSGPHKKTREYTLLELTRAHQRFDQLEQQALGLTEECNALKTNYRALRIEHTALEAQHVALKGDYTALESQHNAEQRVSAGLRKKYEVAESDTQKWRESCKKALADARAARQDKDYQDKEMIKLAEGERDFKRRAHANKVECSKYKMKYEGLRQEYARLERIREMGENQEDQSLLVVDRDAPDKLEHGVDEDWLDEICEVRGDKLDVGSDYGDDSSKENEYESEEVQVGPSRITRVLGRRATESVDDRERPLPEDRPRPAVPFTSEWNWERDCAEYNEGKTKKRKNEEEAVIGTRSNKLVKVSLQPFAVGKGKTRAREERDNDGRLRPLSSCKQISGGKTKNVLPLKLDSRGHLKGSAILGSRLKFNKNS